MDREQMVEQRAKANYVFSWRGCLWENSAYKEQHLAIARAELEREGRLVAGMKEAASWIAGHRHAARAQLERLVLEYEAEFAPPQRTVEQAAQSVVDNARTNLAGSSYVCVHRSLLDELAAALKRGRP